ncbi:MAG: HYR domain-containing protein, partial [Verrucomicrobia bacterium]|nr:HYR domain-containing protein [Verrucomicrobiota bacterium]
MNDKICLHRKANCAATVLALLALLFVSGASRGSTLVLEGQNKGNASSWFAGNLQNWLELDYIPCRVRITGGPVNSQMLTISFPHITGTTPGFQNLYNFTASPNVVFVTPPKLTAPLVGDWSYSFTVSVTDNKTATIQFLARLAAGAHLNTGSSLMLRGDPESMGNLQIHKPGPGPGQPDLAIVKTGPATAPQGGTITYSLAYTNQAATNSAVGTQISDILPPEITVDANSLSANALLIGNTIFWDLTNVLAHASGQVTFQAVININTPVGRVVTNYSQILSSEDDANYADNTSTWLTTVTPGCSAPVLTCASDKSIECGTPWTFDVPAASDAAASNSLSVVSTTTNALCGQTFSATRTWQATDACGNTAQCSQTVTIVDTTPPTFTCSTNKTVQAGATWTFDEPAAIHGCGSNVISIVSTVTNTSGHCGTTFDATRTWQATDACGNNSQCSQKVTIVDTTAPVIDCSASPNKTVQQGTAWTFDPPTATDNSGGNVITIVSTVTNTSGHCGTTFDATRTWQATDACG